MSPAISTFIYLHFFLPLCRNVVPTGQLQHKPSYLLLLLLLVFRCPPSSRGRLFISLPTTATSERERGREVSSFTSVCLCCRLKPWHMSTGWLCWVGFPGFLISLPLFGFFVSISIFLFPLCQIISFISSFLLLFPLSVYCSFSFHLMFPLSLCFSLSSKLLLSVLSCNFLFCNIFHVPFPANLQLLIFVFFFFHLYFPIFSSSFFSLFHLYSVPPLSFIHLLCSFSFLHLHFIIF